MPEQGSIETHNLSGKPFGRAQRITVAAPYLARKRGNEFAACGAKFKDRAMDHPVVIVENVEPLCSFGAAAAKVGK